MPLCQLYLTALSPFSDKLARLSFTDKLLTTCGWLSLSLRLCLLIKSCSIISLLFLQYFLPPQQPPTKLLRPIIPRTIPPPRLLATLLFTITSTRAATWYWERMRFAKVAMWTSTPVYITHPPGHLPADQIIKLDHLTSQPQSVAPFTIGG